MKIISIETGKFKLDGGAMFGVVPKVIWSKTNPSDINNLCSWSMRSLLIDNGNKKILIDCGIGNKQSDKFFSYYHLHGNETLISSLKKNNYHPDDITDVILTHLHFDHCGGATKFNENGKIETVFKNAIYWSNEKHWLSAINPNSREKASFLIENLIPLKKSGQLDFIKSEGIFISDIDILFVSGHTESQMIPHIKFKNEKIVFCADLLPSTSHIPIPYVMGYDINPLLTLEEKISFLSLALEKSYTLFLQHDYFYSCCNLKKVNNRIELKDKFMLKKIIKTPQ